MHQNWPVFRVAPCEANAVNTATSPKTQGLALTQTRAVSQGCTCNSQATLEMFTWPPPAQMHSTPDCTAPWTPATNYLTK